MWASLLLAGILSGWWGALALAAAPPANRNSLEETSTRTTSVHPPSMSIAVEKPFDYPLSTWNLVTWTVDGRELVDQTPSRDPKPPTQDVPRSTLNERQQLLRLPENGNPLQSDQRSTLEEPSVTSSKHLDPPSSDIWRTAEEDDSIRDAFVSSSKQPNRRLVESIAHPETEYSLTQLSRHSSTRPPFLYPPGSESSMERPRVIRSTKQRPKNRTKADSPREQRRRCRNKGCRGQNWCPDMDVGNRAYLAPTVFEGKARSTSARSPGSNYAVTFEVKQVYKSQPGFQPLQKNDSVRLHFRDKSAPGKSTVCGYDTDGKQQQQRDNQSGVVRANIKRGKVYLVFVNRVGLRNFTILGEPVIRSKKNVQAVQAVVRPDYGEYQPLSVS